VLALLMLAGGAGFVAATAALWVQGRGWTDRRIFAGLVAASVTLSLFCIIAWVATEIIADAPRLLTAVFVGTFALFIGRRLYRELQLLPSTKRTATPGN
jgi:hypothetical protein